MGGILTSQIAPHFIESDPRQAREIFEYAGKPVVCPVAETVWAKKNS